MSPELVTKANAIEAALLREMAYMGQNAVAQNLEVSEATVSRMTAPQGVKDKSEIRKLAELLAALNMRAVGEDSVCIGVTQAIFFQETVIQAANANLAMLRRRYTDGRNDAIAEMAMAGKVVTQ